MNYSEGGFRYKKLQKNVLIKIDNSHGPFQTCKQRSTKIFTNSTVNSYTGKNYSSIKSLIRRLEATGNNKISYPRIKGRNQRADIFLRGGSINQIHKTDFIQNSKLVNKKISVSKKKPLSKFDFHLEDEEEQVQQVYISRHIPLETKKQSINLISLPLKTQTEKPTTLKMISQNINQRLIMQAPSLGNTDLHKFDQVFVHRQSHNFQIAKFQRNKVFSSLKKCDLKATKTPTSNITTGTTNKIQQNLSQNHIPRFSTQSQRIKVSKPVIKTISDIKTQTKKISTQISDHRKPLFYLSQDELHGLNLTAKSFIVMQYPSRQIITGSYFRQVSQIASLTKIITFYCCLLLVEKHNLKIDEEILIIDQQVEQTTGTSAELQQGDRFTFRQICYGLMLPSGNDAALALAKWGGKIIKQHQQNQTQSDIKVFIGYMNFTCLSIGMKSSYFGNPHGLPHSKSGSTVQDVAIVIYEGLKIPFFRQVIKSKSYKCSTQNSGIIREVLWQNTNKLLRRQGFIGVKTGVTITAGPCLSICYETEDKIYIVVLIKTSKLSRRFKQARRILAKSLSKIDANLYRKQIRQISRNDAQLDSDNSEDQQEFNYERNDAQQMKKRVKILTYEM